MRSTMSIMGLYDYDSNIFAQMILPEEMDRALVIDSIILECGELEVVYPHPATLKTAIGLWSQSMLPSWKRQYQAIEAEYNPIHNFDRNEEWHDIGSATGTSGTKVAGFDSGALTQKDESSTEAGSDTTHTGHLYGNIGIQTSASMVAEEVALRTGLSMVELIVKDFKRRFCLAIY